MLVGGSGYCLEAHLIVLPLDIKEEESGVHSRAPGPSLPRE